MAAIARALLFGAVVCAAVMAVAAAADGDSAAVVVGQAKCGDCTRKNMKAEDAFKGLQVAIKCKNSAGEYESKAVGELDGDGAFSVPLAATDLHGADCFAQLHSAASSTPCPGQEPSKIVPLSTNNVNDVDGGKANTFVAIAGKMHYSSSAECTSAVLCDYFHKHPFFDYFHKKPEPKPDPKPTPSPGNGGGGGKGGTANGGGAAPSPSSPVYH
ncbi:hypothetical protein E2562_015176 [Oryza meyeriana var. granulata]|uniref:Proline-rich protein n=1 Tax=Oryza meyeriana var. granulata TaxID=110450 RepID=A0A6G1EWS7_9ORYZ|nr:hypothetical protein E2562_015176 [Oryza meyeriana var. granulata]